MVATVCIAAAQIDPSYLTGGDDVRPSLKMVFGPTRVCIQTAYPFVQIGLRATAQRDHKYKERKKSSNQNTWRHVFAETTRAVPAPRGFTRVIILRTWMYSLGFIKFRSGVLEPRGSKFAQFAITLAIGFYSSLYYHHRTSLSLSDLKFPTTSITNIWNAMQTVENGMDCGS